MYVWRGFHAPVSVPSVLASFTETWSQRLLASINGEYEMKVAKLQGGFVFHAHHDTDEVFYVLSGRVNIELQGLDINKVEGIAEVLFIEKAGAMNTGDAVGVEHLLKGVEDARG
ncbi:hypothetical protein C8R44DRAFT_797808 [Mycena epipterygia]|nr:hypothetical protein C8R44DRAFT_797808 [Mycena epipterygia]